MNHLRSGSTGSVSGCPQRAVSGCPQRAAGLHSLPPSFALFFLPSDIYPAIISHK